MANHGYVKTKKPMTYKTVSEVLKHIREERLNNTVLITDYDDSEPTWEITGIDIKVPLIMWLANEYRFEIRHAPSSFAWYIDSLIINAIAVEFDGIISDDGIDDEWKGDLNRFKTYKEWMNASHDSWLWRAFTWLKLKTTDSRIRNL